MPGTLCRWRLGAFNSAKTSFPLGTFAANMLGSLCISILFLLSHGSVSSVIGCDIIAGLSDGFCGKIVILCYSSAKKSIIVTMNCIAMAYELRMFNYNIHIRSKLSLNKMISRRNYINRILRLKQFFLL